MAESWQERGSFFVQIGDLLGAYRPSLTDGQWAQYRRAIAQLSAPDLQTLRLRIIRGIDTLVMNPWLQKTFESTQDLSDVFYPSRFYNDLLDQRLELNHLSLFSPSNETVVDGERVANVFCQTLQLIQQTLRFMNCFKDNTTENPWEHVWQKDKDNDETSANELMQYANFYEELKKPSLEEIIGEGASEEPKEEEEEERKSLSPNTSQEREIQQEMQDMLNRFSEDDPRREAIIRQVAERRSKIRDKDNLGIDFADEGYLENLVVQEKDTQPSLTSQPAQVESYDDMQDAQEADLEALIQKSKEEEPESTIAASSSATALPTPPSRGSLNGLEAREDASAADLEHLMEEPDEEEHIAEKSPLPSIAERFKQSGVGINR